MVGFNTGMASGDAALKKSWAKDISWLLDRKILTLFTCANDHNDLKCTILMQIVIPHSIPEFLILLMEVLSLDLKTISFLY